MTIRVDESAIKRIEELRATQHKQNLMLRITVDGGGCSGFQYKLELTDIAGLDDLAFANAVLTDETSLPFLNGALITFTDTLIGSEFVIENPNAASGCGCGSSFAI